MKKFLTFILILTALIELTACAPKGPQTLVVMTHDSFAISENVIKAFEDDNHVKVQFLKSGDAGAALNRAILTKANPTADVFFGVDNTFLSRALQEDLYEPYSSPLLTSISDEFKLDSQNRALPVDYGDVCINYDIAYFKDHNLVVPQSLSDLTKPEYKGLLVTENPATSSPGLAFLMATTAQFGDPGYLQYWEQLKANGLVVVNDWNAAYSVNFSGSSGKGEQPMAVSYASSPAAEVVFASPPRTDSPTASILAAGTCFRQIEFVGILKGTKQRALAEKFVDFMLSVSFQEDIPLQMYMYPVNPQAKLPEVFTHFAQIADQPVLLDPALIAANRDKWIQDWTDTVLK